jgi:hypothetical protein
MGRAEAENEMLALKAQLTSAHRGVNPLTSERVTSRRRELERSVALRGLLMSIERLRTDVSQLRQRLQETCEQLAPLAVYAIQKGLVTLGDDGPSQAQLEELWRSLLDDPESQLAARHPRDVRGVIRHRPPTRRPARCAAMTSKPPTLTTCWSATSRTGRSSAAARRWP